MGKKSDWRIKRASKNSKKLDPKIFPNTRMKVKSKQVNNAENMPWISGFNFSSWDKKHWQ